MLKTQQFRTQLACLGEASRFGLVRLLQTRSRFVTELAGEMGLSQSCTTRHLQALKRCGLVCAERHGKRVMYRLCSEDPRAASLLDWALGGRSTPAPKPGGVAVRRPPAASDPRAEEAERRPRSTKRPVTVSQPGPVLAPSIAEAPLEPRADSHVESAQTPETDGGGTDHDEAPVTRRRGDLEDFLL